MDNALRIASLFGMRQLFPREPNLLHFTQRTETEIWKWLDYHMPPGVDRMVNRWMPVWRMNGTV